MQQGDVRIGAEGLCGILTVPDRAAGLVIVAHGSDGRLAPRTAEVARTLNDRGFATLLLDLRRPEEEADRVIVFDIALFASRLASAVWWVRGEEALRDLRIGLFGASTGACAALLTAAQPNMEIDAVVARGGRPDLAGAALEKVEAPTLLILGGDDGPAVAPSRDAFRHPREPSELVVVPGATHLFEEPGALETVSKHAGDWFCRYLSPGGEADPGQDEPVPFRDRRDAGRLMAAALMHLVEDDPVVLALPRGGVPVAFEIATALRAPLDLILVRKLGAPHEPELGIGAIVEGDCLGRVLNEEIVRELRVPDAYIEAETRRQLETIEARRRVYLGGRPPVPVEGRTAIVVDDGIATGGTLRAALEGLARRRPARIVLAVPVAAARVLESFRGEVDEIVCLSAPGRFYSVGQSYRDFTQTRDEEVIDLLARARARDAG